MSFKINNYLIKSDLMDILTKLHIERPTKLTTIKKTSRDIVITCPCDNHKGGQESTPDCHINEQKDNGIPIGFFHCFACGAKGNFLEFIRQTLSTTLDRAEQWLCQNVEVERLTDVIFETILKDPIPLGMFNAGPIDTKKRTSEQATTSDLSITKEELLRLPDWHPYLATRKLSKELCNNFFLRFDPSADQIIFPCFDVKGNLIFTSRRSIKNKIFYLDKNIEKPLYCWEHILKNNISSVIITEGPFDALTAWQYGYPAIATFGSISSDQIKKINSSNLTHVYLMFDNDEAGRKFTETVKKYLKKHILYTVVKIPDRKKDINDLTYDEFWSCLKGETNNDLLLNKN